MRDTYIFWVVDGDCSKVRCNDGNYRKFKDTKGYGALKECISLHTKRGGERLMKTTMYDKCGYIITTHFSENKGDSESIKHNRIPSSVY
jgi:hypothetical protein